MDLDSVPYPHIYPLEEKGIVVKRIKNQDGTFEVRVCDLIRIEEINEDIDENGISAKIVFDYLGEEKNLIIGREDYLNVQNIVKYQRHGLDVINNNVKDVVAHLRNEETRAYKKYHHSKLGFDTYKSKMVYKHYECIGLKSIYNGNYSIKPKGSIEKWWEMFNKEVIGHPSLELICVIGLSSVILGFIGEDMGLDNIICHLTGNSTTGKSTAMKLAISMFGYPDVKKNGLFTSYNSTNNALIKSLAGIKGVPVAFDEISMSNKKELSNIVYKLANGVDKNRLNKNSELRSKETWLTTILSNGEEPIIQSSSNTGLFNRVFEFDNVAWTKDATNAENITRIILKNYGHIGIEFAEYVINQGRKQIIQLYKKNIKKLENEFGLNKIKDGFTDRRIKRHAIFLTTVSLFEEAFEITLSNYEIMRLLMEVEKSSIENRNFDKTSIDYICNFVSINIDKFNVFNKPAKSMEPRFAKSESWGNITISESKTEIEINPLILEETLQKGGFKSPRVVLRELRNSGYLDHEKEKLYRKRKNNLGKISKVYVLIIKNDDEDERFDSINKLLDTLTDARKIKLLKKEKDRMKREFNSSNKEL
ncbi:DUF927 domain-containing protein [Candidatus Clostridium helianthi]|uniref:DUF927 domain-containing protein n=1 Tax=Candidatus Clostridium helianthi TaxID=3381660 RepID=A0ABW8SDT6_9CLOT